MSKITYERLDFAKGTVEKREREIDSREVLRGNALFQRLSTPTKASDKPSEETS